MPEVLGQCAGVWDMPLVLIQFPVRIEARK
jgi:hypothetical protein